MADNNDNYAEREQHFHNIEFVLGRLPDAVAHPVRGNLVTMDNQEDQQIRDMLANGIIGFVRSLGFEEGDMEWIQFQQAVQYFALLANAGTFPQPVQAAHNQGAVMPDERSLGSARSMGSVHSFGSLSVGSLPSEMLVSLSSLSGSIHEDAPANGQANGPADGPGPGNGLGMGNAA